MIVNQVIPNLRQFDHEAATPFCDRCQCAYWSSSPRVFLKIIGRHSPIKITVTRCTPVYAGPRSKSSPWATRRPYAYGGVFCQHVRRVIIVLVPAGTPRVIANPVSQRAQLFFDLGRIPALTGRFPYRSVPSVNDFEQLPS